MSETVKDETILDVYRDLLQDVNFKITDDDVVLVDLKKIDEYNPEAIDDLERDPKTHIRTIRESLEDKYNTSNFVFTNPPSHLKQEIKEAKENFNRLVVTHGQVTAIELETSKLKKARLVCPRCGRVQDVILDDDEISLPKNKTYCDYCYRETEKKIEMKIDMSESEFVPFKRIILQEEPELQEPGREPETIKIWLVGDIVKYYNIKAGDVLEVIGIMKADTKKTKLGINALVSNHHILVYGINQLNSDSLSEVSITNNDKKKIKELASRDDTLSYLASYISPEIYGLEDVKKSIILQMVKGDTGKKRDMIHILLVGDPGTGKSTILRNVKKIYPKTVYVSGSAASGRGLTAIAERDPDTGNYVIKAGALVLASGGIALLDEIDKIAKSEAGLLNEAMEHGSVSVSKAGRVMTLKANTSIIAAANPKLGKFDSAGEIYEQIDIDKTVLSRFDLVFAIQEDTTSMFTKNAMMRVIDTISSEKDTDGFLIKYIAYTKDRKVEITDEAREYLLEVGTDLFSSSNFKGATMRQFESLVRLATAHAKLKLHTQLEKEDIDIAKDLMERAISSISSELDFMAQMTKMSTSKRALAQGILEYARGVETFTLEDLLNRFSGIETTRVEEVLSDIKRDGDILEVRPGIYKIV